MDEVGGAIDRVDDPGRVVRMVTLYPGCHRLLANKAEINCDLVVYLTFVYLTFCVMLRNVSA